MTINNDLYISQSQQAWNEGGQLLWYASISGEHWALTQAPGYAAYLAPFYLMGAPQLGNSLLVAGLALVLYLLLRRLKDEKTAMIGLMLLFFTPLFLVMWQRVYSDALASLAVPGMGGGLYIYYWLRRGELKPRAGALLLGLSGLLIMAGVAVRYTNIVIAAVFGLHFLVMAARSFRRGEGRLLGREALSLVVGVALPLAALLAYHAVAFGSPLKYGYSFNQIPVTFAWHYLGEAACYTIIRSNVINLWAPFLIAMPLILAALPALAASGWRKALPLNRDQADPWPEIDGHVWWLILGWTLAVCGLYGMYEWTAYQDAAQMPYSTLIRFYLPALMPLVIMAALALARLSKRVVAGAIVVAALAGVMLFLQAANIQVNYSAGATPPSLSVPPSGDAAGRLAL